MGTYPPGSTFKPVTALAAMQEHLVSPYSYLPCTGSYASTYDKAAKPASFHNWDPFVNQQMDMPTALAYSCDTYFYQLGDLFYGLPKDRGQPLQKWARELRLRHDRPAPTSARRRAGSCRRSAGAAHVHAGDRPVLLAGRPALEAGRLDPARDRPEGPAR